MAAPGTKAPRSGCRYWLLPLPMDDKWYFSKVDFSRFAEEKCFVSASHLIGNSRGLWNIAHHHSQNSSPQDAHVRDVLVEKRTRVGTALRWRQIGSIDETFSWLQSPCSSSKCTTNTDARVSWMPSDQTMIKRFNLLWLRRVWNFHEHEYVMIRMNSSRTSGKVSSTLNCQLKNSPTNV